MADRVTFELCNAGSLSHFLAALFGLSHFIAVIFGLLSLLVVLVVLRDFVISERCVCHGS